MVTLIFFWLFFYGAAVGFLLALIYGGTRNISILDKEHNTEDAPINKHPE